MSASRYSERHGILLACIEDLENLLEMKETEDGREYHLILIARDLLAIVATDMCHTEVGGEAEK